MHKTIVTIVAILALAAITVVYVWSSHNRYYLVTRSGGGVAGIQHPGAVFEVDKRTGRTWQIGYSKTLVTEEGTVEGPPLRDVPASDVARLAGRAGYTVGSLFGGSLYNPTDWEIREIRVRIYGDAQSAWDRVFLDTVVIAPLSSGDFQIDTGDGNVAKATQWRVISARGFRK